MSKKMKIIPSIFKNKQSKHPWQWPSCKHPKTLSVRCDDDPFSTTTINSAFLDVVGPHEPSTSIEEFVANTHFCSANSSTFSAGDEEDAAPAPPLEVVISGVRLSERLFFEPEETSSIVRDSKNGKPSSGSRRPFKDSVAMALESEDPYLDFKKSMEEMMESQGLFKDWDCLEELLLWYLRMNGKINHRFIVGAFVDLLVGFAAVESKRKKKKKKKTMMVSGSDSTSSTTTYYSSASSSFSSISSPLSPQD